MIFHDAANIFPMMSDEEFVSLKDDIRRHGLREPIWTYQGRIIDGRNRFRACQELGIEPTFREWDGSGSLVAFVVSLNLHRRHLAESQRAMVAEKLATMRQGERTDLSAIAEKLSEADAARLLNVSVDSVGRARKVRNEGIPELEQAVIEGKAPVSSAALIAELPAEEQQEIVARGEKEILKAAKEIRAKKVEQRRQKRLEQIGAIEEMAPLDGKYHVIVADPPWPYEKRAEDITHRGVCPYPSMTLEEICAKPVGELAQDDAVLWLWTTNAFMKEAYQVAEAWGFEVKTILTWAKVRMGLGDWLRGQTEHCLMAVRGKPIVNLTNQTTLLHGEVREHSRKPEEFYQFVETLCAGKKCELFSRTRRQGWAQEGAELDQFTAA